VILTPNHLFSFVDRTTLSSTYSSTPSSIRVPSPRYTSDLEPESRAGYGFSIPLSRRESGSAGRVRGPFALTLTPALSLKYELALFHNNGQGEGVCSRERGKLPRPMGCHTRSGECGGER
jgi:hypothetical protein